MLHPLLAKTFNFITPYLCGLEVELDAVQSSQYLLLVEACLGHLLQRVVEQLQECGVVIGVVRSALDTNTKAPVGVREAEAGRIRKPGSYVRAKGCICVCEDLAQVK